MLVAKVEGPSMDICQQ